MPEMTPERIASLAQSAKERDPNPDPLDAPPPETEMGVAVYLDSAVGDLPEAFRGDVDVHVDGVGCLRVAVSAHGGKEYVYAPGVWRGYTIFRCERRATAELRARVFGFDDSVGYSDAMHGHHGRTATAEVAR